LLVQREAGLLEVTGTETDRAKAGISAADIAAGMYAYSGILAALFARERTGDGATLEVAMLDALGEWMSQPVSQAVYSGAAPKRTGARHASISPYGPFRASDGNVFLSIQNNREWVRLCELVLRTPTLAADVRFSTNSRRVIHDAELVELINVRLEAMTSDEVVALLDDAGIANAHIRTPSEFAAHPQLAARERWRDVATPAGMVSALLPPLQVEGLEAAMGSVPTLGEHTATVRREVGK